MKEAFGDNFKITKKIDIEQFFGTMVSSLTESIEDSELRSRFKNEDEIARKAREKEIPIIYE